MAEPILTAGDKLTWQGVAVAITRVARDGSWADLRCRDAERTWSKRQRLPLPAGMMRVDAPIPGCTCEDCEDLAASNG